MTDLDPGLLSVSAPATLLWSFSFFALPQTHQTHSCLRAFAHSPLSAWNGHSQRPPVLAAMVPLLRARLQSSLPWLPERDTDTAPPIPHGPAPFSSGRPPSSGAPCSAGSLMRCLPSPLESSLPRVAPCLCDPILRPSTHDST